VGIDGDWESNRSSSSLDDEADFIPSVLFCPPTSLYALGHVPAEAWIDLRARCVLALGLQGFGKLSDILHVMIN